MAEISVSKIEIKIGKKIVVLTPDELKELRDVLDKTFPKKETVYIPGKPIIIERENPWNPWRKQWDYWEPKWIAEDGSKYDKTTFNNTPMLNCTLRLESTT